MVATFGPNHIQHRTYRFHVRDYSLGPASNPEMRRNAMRNLTSPPSILPRLNSDPRIYRIRWIALVLGLAWLMGPRATTVEAQTSEDYLDAIGIPAFTTAQPVEKGFINLSNGNLHLNLPLTSLPQRAGSQATVSLMYDSRIWSWSGILGWGGEWVANPAYVVSSAGGWMGGWRLVSTAYPGGVAPLGDEDEQYCPSTDSYDGDKIGPFGWAEPDGTQHNFRIFVHETFENWCGGLHHSAVPASAGDAFADDASGFHMYLAAAPNVYTQGTITVYGPDVTKV